MQVSINSWTASDASGEVDFRDGINLDTARVAFLYEPASLNCDKLKMTGALSATGGSVFQAEMSGDFSCFYDYDDLNSKTEIVLYAKDVTSLNGVTITDLLY